MTQGLVCLLASLQVAVPAEVKTQVGYAVGLGLGPDAVKSKSEHWV